MIVSRFHLFVCAALLLCGSALADPQPPSPLPPALSEARALEQQVEQALEFMARGELEEAALLARQLSDDHPRFRLGHWLHAELSSLAAMDPLLLSDQSDWSAGAVSLLLEARTRLETARYEASLDSTDQSGALLPRSLVHLGSNVRDAIVVDLSRSELMHFTVDQGQATLVSRHYASSGSSGFGKRFEGDRKTPLGVYRILGHHRGSMLPDLYGDGALTLDYPNALDRSLGRTGSGIWLHGVPQASHNRGPWSSEGCVTMPNAYIAQLIDRIDRDRTLVVLADEAGWIDPAGQQALREQLRLDALTYLNSDVSAVAIYNSTLLEVPDDTDSNHIAWWPADSGTGAKAWKFMPVERATGQDTLASLNAAYLTDGAAE